MKQVLFLVNPVSGKRAGVRIEEQIRAGLAGRLPRDRFDIHSTRPALQQQLREAAPQYAAVVAAGGDGTISQVVDAVAALDRKPNVGLIPLGTGNDLARSIGVWPVFRRSGIAGLLDVILAGKTAPVDVWQINDTKRFVNYCGVGIDAKIAADFDRLRSRPAYRALCTSGLGKALYGWLGLSNLAYRIDRPVRLRYPAPGAGMKDITLPAGGCQVLVTNVQTYAGGRALSSHCRIDDGRFEVTVIAGLLQWLRMHLSRVQAQPLNVQCPGLMQFQTEGLEISVAGSPACQLDGEIFAAGGSSPGSIAIRHAAQVNMIVA